MEGFTFCEKELDSFWCLIYERFQIKSSLTKVARFVMAKGNKGVKLIGVKRLWRLQLQVLCFDFQ